MNLNHLGSRIAFITTLFLTPVASQAQDWRRAPAYDKALAANVLDRSVFFLPLYGAVYRAKFEAMIKEVPGIRGVVIHNHGCGGNGAGRRMCLSSITARASRW